MIDVKSYSWLDASTPIPAMDEGTEQEATMILQELDHSSYSLNEREALARVYFNEILTKPKNHIKKGERPAQLFSSWKRTNAYQRELGQLLQRDHTKLMMCGLVIIMSGTLCLYFLWAVITQKFVVSFSIDAIVASIALVFLSVNVRSKYRLLRRDGAVNNYVMLDVISLILCLLLKAVLPSMFDLSLFVLFLTYIIEKKRWERSNSTK